ncbi:hypothetical protein DK846_12890 [Methanospirillum lacunae]|uniref:DUF2202 domain-containing protein n=1 Tax=Methanospirillum lacunae TaxID=668570 RepID=A0A2V2MRY7_9EURY|nr:hypothetical protein DK846_12890 [Methanospirillum lacunae]
MMYGFFGIIGGEKSLIQIELLIGLLTIAVILPASVSAQGYGGIQGGNLLNIPDPLDYNLSEIEIADLRFMHSEEQMSHDLYAEWSEKYSLPVFDNIAQSETTHTQSVKFLLDRYNLTPGSAPTEIQDFSASLKELGNKSLVDALSAGVKIEEQDIADLDRAIANTTREDLKTVYENLKSGSENHLAAFTKQLS